MRYCQYDNQQSRIFALNRERAGLSLLVVFAIISVACILMLPGVSHAKGIDSLDLVLPGHTGPSGKRSLQPLGASHHLFVEGVEAYEAGDFDLASSVWFSLAYQGHTEAQYQLANLYLNGWGVEYNVQAALKWFRKAALQGHTQALYNMGVAYAKGIGVPTDAGEAVVWWHKAALMGSTDAQFNLGLMYSSGYGVIKDMVVAARWWKIAARSGDAAAQFNLGMLYANGEGVGQNWNKAITLWRNSAEQGFAHAVRALEALNKPGAKRIDAALR